jgi:hypothetical protein
MSILVDCKANTPAQGCILIEHLKNVSTALPNGSLLKRYAIDPWFELWPDATKGCLEALPVGVPALPSPQISPREHPSECVGHRIKLGQRRDCNVYHGMPSVILASF